MKNLISLLTLLIFILNISHNLFSAEANDGVSTDPVLDSEGNELKTGTNYYVLSNFSPGGGVSLYPLANRTCTFAVNQLVFGRGQPIVFGNGGTDLGEVIRESTDLIISFAPKLSCPTVWELDDYDEAVDNYFVVAGESNWDKATVNNRFQIRKDPSLGSYLFYFCPNALICTDIGVLADGRGGRRLALYPNFHSTFGFRKAS